MTDLYRIQQKHSGVDQWVYVMKPMPLEQAKQLLVTLPPPIRVVVEFGAPVEGLRR